MGYASINNLYRDQEILLFKECYALEKIHGTSAHIRFTNVSEPAVKFFSGGEKHESFVKLFSQDDLIQKFLTLNQTELTVFGEAYGGKCQGMSATYGKELKFVAFDVKIGDSWLEIPKAEAIVKQLGLEFVHYTKISTDLTAIDKERDADSVQAVRNGCGAGKIREGVVLRPLIEVTKNNGERICAKHKRDEFRETKSPRPIVDVAQLKILADAEAVANEFVVKERLNHVISKMQNGDSRAIGIEDTGLVIKNMINDIKREGEKEIVWNKDVEKTIGKFTAILFKKSLTEKLV